MDFVVGHTYTRASVQDAVGVPEGKRGGDWATGYTKFKDEIFIFCNIDTAGRTGHDYPNRWVGKELVWSAKSRTTINQPLIKLMASGSARIHLFYRNADRAPFKYAGLAVPVEVIDSKPVTFRWRFESGASQRGFLLTWKEAGWPHSNLVRMEKSFLKNGYVEEAWRLRASNTAQIGDLVWLLRQGPGEKGIFGFGQLVGSPKRGIASDGKTKMQALVRFSKFSDPRNRFLIPETQVREVLSESQIKAQASGDPLRAAQVASLSALLPTVSKIIEPDESDDDNFDPKDDKDARKKIARLIAQRRGQRKFRNSLLAAYDQRCAVTGSSILDILEAAHIRPYRNDETNKAVNGLLLRSDIHTLFDCGLISVDANTMKVILSKGLLNSEYKRLEGKKLRKTKLRSQMPDRTALSMHNKEWGFE